MTKRLGGTRRWSRSALRPEFSRLPAIGWALLGLQLVIPAVVMLVPGPTRWGWQMFRSLEGLFVVEAVSNTETATIDVPTYFANFRPEIRLDRWLAPRLCEQGWRSVRIVDLGASRELWVHCD